MLEKSTRAECELVDEGIVVYKLPKVPFTPKPSFANINRAIQNPKGEVLVGIQRGLYCWKCVRIDVLWAKDLYLKHGYEIFGILEDCSSEHRQYYLKKNLQI